MVFTEKQKIDEALEVIDEMLENAEKEKNKGSAHAFRKFPYVIGHEQLNLLYRVVKILTQEGVPRDE
tara:strand:+ start:453 stop:653 length:201 start_codon:yes stop_codon:yes gene_type:complete